MTCLLVEQLGSADYLQNSLSLSASTNNGGTWMNLFGPIQNGEKNSKKKSLKQRNEKDSKNSRQNIWWCHSTLTACLFGFFHQMEGTIVLQYEIGWSGSYHLDH